MKKILAFFLSLSFVFSGIVLPTGVSVFATGDTTEESTTEETTGQTQTEETTENLWEYETYGDGVMLTKYNGTQIDVYAPAVMDVNGESVPVLKLADNLFSDNDSLNSVTLGEGITEIGESTFAECDNLVCIVTPQSLTTIGKNAFSDCTAFNSVILYDGITTIGENTFANCPSLTIYCNENTTGYNYALDNFTA